MPYLVPPLCTEHETGPDDDCVFCSGIMQILAKWPGRCPATLSEAEAIRAAAGIPDGPASSADLVRGITKRYGDGYAPTIVTGAAALWDALNLGMSATASGHPVDAPPGSPFRHWLGGYVGGHRVFVERLDATDRVWLMDPEGPAGTSYRGEWASRADLMAFVRNGSAHTVQSIKFLYPTRTIRCAAPLRASPTRTGTIVASVPAGTLCEVISTVRGDAWAFWCGAPRAGSEWLHVYALGKTGYIAAGRF